MHKTILFLFLVSSLDKYILCRPHILHNVLLLDGVTHFFFYLVKNMIFRKDFESSLIFILFLRENKIRKKTLSVTPYLEKTI